MLVTLGFVRHRLDDLEINVSAQCPAPTVRHRLDDLEIFQMSLMSA